MYSPTKTNISTYLGSDHPAISPTTVMQPGTARFDEYITYFIRKYGWSMDNFLEIYKTLLDKSPPLVDSSNMLGIEVEAEGIDPNWSPIITNCGFWNWAQDGSLKDRGVEFISKPIAAKNAVKALAFLYASLEAFNKGHTKFDWRSSIHVHLNMTGKNTVHVMKLLLLFMIFEDSLFEFADAKRKNSIFCVPIYKSGLCMALSDYLYKDCNFLSVIEQWNKYSSLNILPLTSKGTIEFRIFPGTDEFKKIIEWINIILSLDVAADKLSIEEIHAHVSKLNTDSYYRKFKTEIFGESVASTIRDSNLAQHMSDNIKFVKGVFVPVSKIYSEVIKQKDSAFMEKIQDYYQEKDKLLKTSVAKGRKLGASVNWDDLVLHYANTVNNPVPTGLDAQWEEPVATTVTTTLTNPNQGNF